MSMIAWFPFAKSASSCDIFLAQHGAMLKNL